MMRTASVLAFRQSAPISAAHEAILAEHQAGEDRVLEEAMNRIDAETPTLRSLVGFAGPVSMGLVTGVAAGLEQDGRRTCLRWLRDLAGIIDGVAICEVLGLSANTHGVES